MERVDNLNKQIKEDKVIIKKCKHPSTVSVLLNNPKRLNSLDVHMFKKLNDVVSDFNHKIIIIRGVGDKAFSCGGDVKSLHKYITQKDDESLMQYFDSEFKMDYAYFLQNQIPNCALITIYNGIAIGGSITMSIYSKIRICSENTLISLPECKNGLLVPSIQYFSNLRDNLGVYLMMTGDFIKGEDCVKYGLADYFVEHSKLVDLQNELEMQENLESCHKICKKYAQNIDVNQIRNKEYIKDLFQLTDFNTFWQNINQKASQNQDLKLQKFAQHCLKQMNLSSKISIRVNYSMILSSFDSSISFNQFMLLQARSAINLTKLSTDCQEGLKKAVIDRNYIPQWSHETVESVSQQEIDQILNDETQIQSFTRQMIQSFDDVNNLFIQKQNYQNKLIDSII
ncbi:enoyl-CoA hydratase/isomerase (macronuclear) [Tetrahymena thermophila SB210]|uniref:3-hydroxyisobutyryl-CoA hydrolase n=1 Tax=Tetrahymena thermophila (strain SB210) TaxID=312017 RepID=Q22U60_TETTS|nr:enoyl-CoA hydratase/isomerase [Tetrahymena thermophila SB210]EAR88827.1 enoyl-CoA hydratase/isomerase [Tetrahymena thermophila SB210]|eukprot:XP_001009072.1 enoyl-CoA hydratase/isomerase [Tetrahymena thermophila SB210]